MHRVAREATVEFKAYRSPPIAGSGVQWRQLHGERGDVPLTTFTNGCARGHRE